MSSREGFFLKDVKIQLAPLLARKDKVIHYWKAVTSSFFVFSFCFLSNNTWEKSHDHTVDRKNPGNYGTENSLNGWESGQRDVNPKSKVTTDRQLRVQGKVWRKSIDISRVTGFAFACLGEESSGRTGKRWGNSTGLSEQVQLGLHA